MKCSTGNNFRASSNWDNRTPFYCVRPSAHFFPSLKAKCPVPIVFDFEEPIALWQLLNRERLHGFNERGRFFGFAFTICQYPCDELTE
jgi:hypothetical protein